jgi:hypothetical protein
MTHKLPPKSKRLLVSLNNHQHSNQILLDNEQHTSHHRDSVHKLRGRLSRLWQLLTEISFLQMILHINSISTCHNGSEVVLQRISDVTRSKLARHRPPSNPFFFYFFGAVAQSAPPSPPPPPTLLDQRHHSSILTSTSNFFFLFDL